LTGLAAILMSLSFHPLPLHFLAWFGMVPLLYAQESMRVRQSFRTGFFFGFLFALFVLFWIVFLQIETNIKLLIVFGLVVLFAYIGLYFGVALTIAKKTSIWALPLVITALEFVRGIGELGFPWLSLGYSQARYPMFIQQASIYGVYGISFWLVLLNVAIYKALRRKTYVSILSAVLIFIVPVIYGLSRIDHVRGKAIAVGIVQPNIDPNLKFSRELRFKTFERLMSLSGECARASLDEYGESPSLIVWPETATPVFLKSPGKYQDLVKRLVDGLGVPLFAGTAIYEPKDHEIFNGAVLIEPGKDIEQDYRKIYLVPFGEHIPFDRQIAFLRSIDFGEGDYTPGTSHTVFQTPGFEFACLICFESIFPELSRRFVNNGADMLVNITNDGWFGKISGPQQHNDMAILRSVENGVVLLRSANTGISMIVDQYGRVLNEKPLFVQATIVSMVTVSPINTLYRRIGDTVPVASLLLTTVLLVVTFLKARWQETGQNK
ncbi:MAG: apolipoprotein N-acyltransferase, partial [candidate division WOR-3 bacterium]